MSATTTESKKQSRQIRSALRVLEENAKDRSPQQERLFRLILEVRKVTPENPRGEITEQGFAKLTGLSTTTLQNIGIGRKHVVSSDTLKKIASYIGWRLEELEDYVTYGVMPENKIVGGKVKTTDAILSLEVVLNRIRQASLTELCEVFEESANRLTDLSVRNHLKIN